jgi:xanthine/CO dehydrogenase XdhC/CoxF family maturation factor
MLITSEGAIAGSLSAGCLEDEVAAAGQEVITSGLPRLMVFDTRRRFGCHGSIEIFVERVADAFLEKIASNLQARRTFTISTRFDGDVFVQQIEPVIQLLVVGTGPDAVALCSQAHLLGWEASMIESIVEWRGQLDARTAAVVATHNYGRDCAALRYLLEAGLLYLGIIGPRKRRDEIVSDVLDSGAEMKSQLFGPAGLDLGSETAEEIALAIVSEIQGIFAGGTGESLRDSKSPIHHADRRSHPGRGSVVSLR